MSADICGPDCPEYMGIGCDFNSDSMVQCKRLRLKIGENFKAEEGAVIGGQSTSFDEEGRLVRALSGLEIGPNVWVGPNAVIMSGHKRPTKIGANVKIGALCNVGHDVIIGDNAKILNGTIIAGYAEIGEGAVIAIGVKIRNRIKVGKGSFIGMGSVVVKNIPPYCVAYGNPARVNVRKTVKSMILRCFS